MQPEAELFPTPQFIKDIQYLNRLDITIKSDISAALDILLETRELPEDFQDHALTGLLATNREFHVRDTAAGSQPSEINDVLVIYRWRNKRLTLVAIAAGSPDKLFSNGKGKS
ncbi:MAG: type II toxin-antitoxin system YafQ family toxin [Streptococcaceae bacterium]|jgi:mRNA interferase YafQ|nr:type II toxin-antitoxin system YafQ family toxin [Streptococcaceae bacterium]